MKVKLLKKVRKRFKIIRYDSTIGMPQEWVHKETETPFFIIHDKKDFVGAFYIKAFRTFKDAVSHLQTIIRKTYESKFKKPSVTKVWWVK